MLPLHQDSPHDQINTHSDAGEFWQHSWAWGSVNSIDWSLGGASIQSSWNCSHCSYKNGDVGNDKCAMCGNSQHSKSRVEQPVNSDDKSRISRDKLRVLGSHIENRLPDTSFASINSHASGRPLRSPSPGASPLPKPQPAGYQTVERLPPPPSMVRTTTIATSSSCNSEDTIPTDNCKRDRTFLHELELAVSVSETHEGGSHLLTNKSVPLGGIPILPPQSQQHDREQSSFSTPHLYFQVMNGIDFNADNCQSRFTVREYPGTLESPSSSEHPPIALCELIQPTDDSQNGFMSTQEELFVDEIPIDCDYSTDNPTDALWYFPDQRRICLFTILTGTATLVPIIVAAFCVIGLVKAF